MKDQVFSGADLPSAKAAAAQALGLKEETLRFVVLDAGAPAGLGLTARPARIAVLIAAPPARGFSPPAPLSAADWKETLGSLLRAFSEASGIPLSFEIREGEDTVTVRLGGDREALLRDDAALVRALEHLFQRAFTESLDRRLVLDCEGLKDEREEGLRRRARAWAAEVKRTGRPRETPPLNAYERRLVHMAVAEEPGLRTFSVGEGASRRVTIALQEAPAEPPPDGRDG